MKNKFALSIIIFIIVFSTFTAFAEDTVIKEDGKTIGFQLEESTPQNNSVDVALDIEIMLLFNKNVVNMTVKENNAKCIVLKNSNGEIVSSELIFPDDQIEPERKREIIIKPNEPLNENETYKVEISSNMQAKNGSLLGETTYVLFTTIKTLPKENLVEEVVQAEDQIIKEKSEIESTAVVNEDVTINNEDQVKNESKSETVLSESSNDSSLNVNDIDSHDGDNVDAEEKASFNQEDDQANNGDIKNTNNELSNKNILLAAILIVTAIFGIFIFIKMKKG